MDSVGAKKAKSALICGIVSLFCFGFVLGIIAIVQGFQARKLLAQSNESTGNATAAIVLGIIGVIGWVFAMFYMPTLMENLGGL